MDIADKEYKKTEWPDHFRARGAVLISDSYKTFDDGWCCFKAIDEDGKLISIAVSPRDLDIIPHLRRGLVVTHYKSSGGCHYYDMKPDKEFICFSKENKEDVLKTLLFDDTVYGDYAIGYGYLIRKNLSTLSRTDKHLYYETFLKDVV